MRDAEQELGWCDILLDRAGVPVESYAAQAGGNVAWTTAGRVDHVLSLLAKHGVDVNEDVIAPLEASNAPKSCPTCGVATPPPWEEDLAAADRELAEGKTVSFCLCDEPIDRACPVHDPEGFVRHDPKPTATPDTSDAPDEEANAPADWAAEQRALAVVVSTREWTPVHLLAVHPVSCTNCGQTTLLSSLQRETP